MRRPGVASRPSSHCVNLPPRKRVHRKPVDLLAQLPPQPPIVPFRCREDYQSPLCSAALRFSKPRRIPLELNCRGSREPAFRLDDPCRISRRMDFQIGDTSSRLVLLRPDNAIASAQLQCSESAPYPIEERRNLRKAPAEAFRNRILVSSDQVKDGLNPPAMQLELRHSATSRALAAADSGFVRGRCRTAGSHGLPRCIRPPFPAGYPDFTVSWHPPRPSAPAPARPRPSQFQKTS